MKNLIIIIGTAVLGLVIYDMMIGNEPDTLQSAVATGMKNMLQLYGE